MALIPVERAQVGMVLAEGVTDRRGRLLIPAGKEITERYLDSLPMWGVTHVEIEGEDTGSEDEVAEAAEPWAVSKAMEVVDDHFMPGQPIPSCHEGAGRPLHPEESQRRSRRRASHDFDQSAEAFRTGSGLGSTRLSAPHL